MKTKLKKSKSKTSKKVKNQKRYEPTPRAERSVVVGMISEKDIVGVFIDAGHASFVNNLSVNDVKEDLKRGTARTGIYWLKVDAGDTLDTREIVSIAKKSFKSYTTTQDSPIKRGRKPKQANKESVKSLIKDLELGNMTEEAKKRLEKFISTPENKKRGRGRPKLVK